MPQFPETLSGGQLELRRSRPEFIDDLMKAVGVSYPELHRWMTWCQTMPLREDMVAFLNEAVLAFDSDQWWGYSLFEVASGELVGSAVLRRMSETEPEGLEIGYWVRSDRTKRSYATSASATLIDAAFTRLTSIERIRISMDAANAASAAIPRKLGFRFLGEVERDVAAVGQSSSSAIWELSRSA